MMLYDISEEYRVIKSNLEAACAWEPDTDADGNPIDGNGEVIADVPTYREILIEAWKDTLEAAQGEFTEKAENLGALIKELKAESDALRKVEEDTKARRRAKEAAYKRLTDYLLEKMLETGNKKLDTPRALISVRNNPESVSVSDEKAFIEWAEVWGENLLRYKFPEIDKTAVKKVLQSGETLPFASLERKQSLTVK